MSAGDDYIVFGKPAIGEAEIAEVVDSLRSAWIGTGPKVARFEAAFRDYLGAEHAVALHSCTAALFLSQLALGIGRGDAVVTTPLTFVATANAIRHTGALPLFADVEPESGLLAPRAVERLIEEQFDRDAAGGLTHRASGARLRAILPVHLWGQPADALGFRALCDRHRLHLIEDAAHAIESTCGARKVGTIADVTCFSFYATKNLTTGEGGMISTARAELAQRVRTLANHGLSRDAWKRFSAGGYQHYSAIESGWKFNMMDLQAALALPQLPRLAERLVERERQWRAYASELAGLPGIALPPEAAHGRHARHLFTLRVGEGAALPRDALMGELHRRGVGTGVHYLAVSEHPAFAGALNLPVPNAERIGRETLSLPLGGALTEAQRRRVVSALRAAAGAPG